MLEILRTYWRPYAILFAGMLIGMIVTIVRMTTLHGDVASGHYTNFSPDSPQTHSEFPRPSIPGRVSHH